MVQLSYLLCEFFFFFWQLTTFTSFSKLAKHNDRASLESLSMLERACQYVAAQGPLQLKGVRN